MSMVLDYVALGLLILSFVLCAYAVVAVWGIPYEIAKARDHPHRDAIGAATWVSLLTLGALWPFLWIWAMAYRPDRGWGFSADAPVGKAAAKDAQLELRVAALEREVRVR